MGSNKKYIYANYTTGKWLEQWRTQAQGNDATEWVQSHIAQVVQLKSWVATVAAGEAFLPRMTLPPPSAISLSTASAASAAALTKPPDNKSSRQVVS